MDISLSNELSTISSIDVLNQLYGNVNEYIGMESELNVWDSLNKPNSNANKQSAEYSQPHISL